MSKYRPLTKTDTMPFGKYKGDTIAEIISKDYNYFQWLKENTDVRFDLFEKKDSKNKLASLDTILKTGKYKGLTVAEVIRNDVNYVKLNLKGRMDWRCNYYCDNPKYALKGLWQLIREDLEPDRKAFISADELEEILKANAAYQRAGLEYMASIRPAYVPFD